MKKILFSLALVLTLIACEKSEENNGQKEEKSFDISGQWLGTYNDESILLDINYTLPGYLIEARQNEEYAKKNKLDISTYFYENLFDSYVITIDRDSSTIYYPDADFISTYKIINDSIITLPEEYDTTEFKSVTGTVIVEATKDK